MNTSIKFSLENLISSGWILGTQRPENEALVAYLFEPFMSLHVGRYDSEFDSVCGRSGFTTWQPEVLCWYPLPE
jgi:hypothetical protein